MVHSMILSKPSWHLIVARIVATISSILVRIYLTSARTALILHMTVHLTRNMVQNKQTANITNQAIKGMTNVTAILQWLHLVTVVPYQLPCGHKPDPDQNSSFIVHPASLPQCQTWKQGNNINMNYYMLCTEGNNMNMNYYMLSLVNNCQIKPQTLCIP